MLDLLHYRLALRRLNRKASSELEMLDAKLEEARGQKRPPSEIEDLVREYSRTEVKRVHGVKHLTTIYLTRTGQKYLIPVPELSLNEVERIVI
jgi:hypothetical protein